MTQFHLLRERRFAPLFWTQFFGAFNDNFLKNALVILVTFHSMTVMGMPPSEIVALAGGIFILPFFLFSALAGQIADKYDKAIIVRWVKLVEIFIMLLATFGFLFNQPGFLLIVLFAMGLHSTFFGPIKYSILPQHLKSDELVAGNALVEAGTFVAILLGTIAGGVLVALPNGQWIVSFALLAIAVIGYVVCLFIPKAPAVAPQIELQFNPVTPTWQMFEFTRKPFSVFISILAISWFWFFGAAMLSLFPPLCKDVLKGDEHTVTTFLAIFSVGIAVGSLLTAKLSHGRLNLKLVPMGVFGLFLFGVGLSWLSSQGVSSQWIEIDLFLLSMAGGLFIVPLYTLMQERSDARQRSRVIAANNIMNALFMVVASLCLIGLFRLEFTIPQMILILAAGNLAVLVMLRVYRLQ